MLLKENTIAYRYLARRGGREHYMEFLRTRGAQTDHAENGKEAQLLFRSD